MTLTKKQLRKKVRYVSKDDNSHNEKARTNFIQIKENAANNSKLSRVILIKTIKTRAGEDIRYYKWTMKCYS